jgi:hypothetical protein
VQLDPWFKHFEVVVNTGPMIAHFERGKDGEVVTLVILQLENLWELFTWSSVRKKPPVRIMLEKRD